MTDEECGFRSEVGFDEFHRQVMPRWTTTWRMGLMATIRETVTEPREDEEARLAARFRAAFRESWPAFRDALLQDWVFNGGTREDFEKGVAAATEWWEDDDEDERQVERRHRAEWQASCPHPFDERVPIIPPTTRNPPMICLLCGKVFP